MQTADERWIRVGRPNTPLPLLRQGQFFYDYPVPGDVTAIDLDPETGELVFAYPNLWDVSVNQLFICQFVIHESGERTVEWFPLAPPPGSRPQVGWKDLFKAVAERLMG